MEGKPKFFIFQCCRKKDRIQPFELESYSEEEESEMQLGMDVQDMYLQYATLSQDFAKRGAYLKNMESVIEKKIFKVDTDPVTSLFSASRY